MRKGSQEGSIPLKGDRPKYRRRIFGISSLQVAGLCGRQIGNCTAVITLLVPSYFKMQIHFFPLLSFLFLKSLKFVTAEVPLNVNVHDAVDSIENSNILQLQNDFRQLCFLVCNSIRSLKSGYFKLPKCQFHCVIV